jgi:hypothetical protein
MALSVKIQTKGSGEIQVDIKAITTTSEGEHAVNADNAQ